MEKKKEEKNVAKQAAVLVAQPVAPPVAQPAFPMPQPAAMTQAMPIVPPQQMQPVYYASQPLTMYPPVQQHLPQYQRWGQGRGRNQGFQQPMRGRVPMTQGRRGCWVCRNPNHLQRECPYAYQQEGPIAPTRDNSKDGRDQKVGVATHGARVEKEELRQVEPGDYVATEQRLQGEGIWHRLVQLAQSEEDTDPEDVEQSEAPAYNTRERNKKKLQQRIEPGPDPPLIVDPNEWAKNNSAENYTVTAVVRIKFPHSRPDANNPISHVEIRGKPADGADGAYCRVVHPLRYYSGFGNYISKRYLQRTTLIDEYRARVYVPAEYPFIEIRQAGIDFRDQWQPSSAPMPHFLVDTVHTVMRTD
ncbi:hypothetical protein QTP70_009278 [Hemibagrus guttatus]|uniref:Uncharacterized protein n=1 Tax=Hemibagrus guttatus TaxID=175788 RepID=A0AAE0UVP4_9TELE|nr:hypothetical protein QTP70_009278 [Hemibagrus guttatus]